MVTGYKTQRARKLINVTNSTFHTCELGSGYETTNRQTDGQIHTLYTLAFQVFFSLSSYHTGQSDSTS